MGGLKTRVHDVYRNHVGKFYFEVGVNAALAALGVGIPKLFKPNAVVEVIISAAFIFLIAAHTYLLKVTKEKKFNELGYWKEKSRRYSWLMNSIRELIHRKTKAMRRGNLPENFRKESVWKNMQMLYHFYSHFCQEDDPVGIRVALFLPTPEIDALYVEFWYYSDGQRPHFIGKMEKQRELFSIRNGRTLVVEAFNSRHIQVRENPSEILYQYHGQENFIKSMLAYPIIGEDGAQVIGVICVSANKQGFFKKNEVETHREFIDEVAIRIAFELAILNRKPDK